MQFWANDELKSMVMQTRVENGAYLAASGVCAVQMVDACSRCAVGPRLLTMLPFLPLLELEKQKPLPFYHMKIEFHLLRCIGSLCNTATSVGRWSAAEAVAACGCMVLSMIDVGVKTTAIPSVFKHN